MAARIEIEVFPQLVEVTSFESLEQYFVRTDDSFRWTAYLDDRLIDSGNCRTFKSAEKVARMSIAIQRDLDSKYQPKTIIEVE